MTPRNQLLIKRIGGGVLLLVGMVFLIGPLSFAFWGFQIAKVGASPKVIGEVAYQTAFGLLLALMGFYFLTRRATKAQEDDDRN